MLGAEKIELIQIFDQNFLKIRRHIPPAARRLAYRSV